MNNELILISDIRNCIFDFRGVQVMIDRDLAELYQVETKVLNQAVKRNIERFPKEFRFQLSEEETKQLVKNCDRFGHFGDQRNSSRSQNVTLNSGRGRNIKYLPYAFTEQGISMLSAVLRSATAIRVSIQIMNAFVEMRRYISSNAAIFHRLDHVEQKQIESDEKFDRIFKAIEEKSITPSQGIFFDGQIFDSYTLIADIVRKAKKQIVLIDNYIDDSVLTLFSKKNKGVSCSVFTKNISKQLKLDVEKFNSQYGKLSLHKFDKAHDRFLILDMESDTERSRTEVYHIGASLKDLGKKWFAFTKMDKNSVSQLLTSISKML